MTDIKTVAREAAYSTDGARYLGRMYVDEMADAVTVAVGKEWARYRPQHDEDCGLMEDKPCSCGLDNLLSALKEHP